MELEQFTNLIENDMNEALKKVLAGFSGAGGFDKLLPIFQDLGLDGARAAAAISSMANSLDKVEAAQSIANKAMLEGVSCYNEFSIKNNNMQANLEKARKKFQDTRLELGEKLYPILLKLTKTSTAGNNQRGRIALLEDASGFQTFKYGRMGEVIENNRTFVLPNERYPYSFKMKYTYDSWNRVQDITYPDGEVVHYKYNTGGMLRQVQGQRSFFSGLDSVIIGPFDPLNPREDEYDDPTADNAPDFATTGMGDRATYHNYLYNYITDIRYNEFELKSGQWYGNGTRSQYTYDILQRLSNLQLYNSGNSRLQNISYTYDRVGNITRIQNTAGMISSLGGEYNCRYTYDSLYRLVQATDTSYRGFKLAGRYEQLTSYFPDGRIQYKQDETWTNTSSFPFISNTYTYGNTNQPHTVTSTGNGINTPTTYTWDANGNMTKQGNNIVMRWDEENRLATYSRTGLGACYFYSADGERFYKNSGEKRIMLVNGSYYMTLPYYDSPVLYASPYVVATKDGYTKHYFVESERFASRIGDGKITNISSHATTSAILASKQATVNDAAPDSIAPNQFTFLRTLSARWSEHHTTFWQHPDHLGSASWVTDTNGRGYQHLQYRAWGETFIDQHVSGANYEARFTFSGKERDEESGFCYFGARPYNPALALWLAVDPLSDKYPGVSPYVYCANNPVRLVDVDGREIGWIDDGNGTVFWDKNTNSEEEFSQNYAGRSGFSYASDANNPSSYTLPNGLGKIQVNEWKEYGIEDGGPGGPAITLEFIPSAGNNASGWLQTFSSNIPDVDSGPSVYTALPQEHAEERFDFQTIYPALPKYSNKKGPLLLADQPGRKLNEGAQYSVNWNAQSSILVDQNRVFTVSWGFTITAEKSIEYFTPRIINNPSLFHIETIRNLK